MASDTTITARQKSLTEIEMENQMFCFYINKDTRERIWYPRAETGEDFSLMRLRRKMNNCQIKLYSFWTLTFTNDSLRDGLFKSASVRKFFNRLKRYLYLLDVKAGKAGYVEERHHYQSKKSGMFYSKLKKKQVWDGKLKYVWKYEEGSHPWDEYPEDLVEFQGSRPHYHCFVNRFIEKKKMDEIWGLGNCHFVPIKNKMMMALYLKKYFKKDESLKHWEGGRRFSFSTKLPVAKSKFLYAGFGDFRLLKKFLDRQETLNDLVSIL